MLWKSFRCTLNLNSRLQSDTLTRGLSASKSIDSSLHCGLLRQCPCPYTQSSFHTSSARLQAATRHNTRFNSLGFESPEEDVYRLSRSSQRHDIDAWLTLLNRRLPEDFPHTSIETLDHGNVAKDLDCTRVLVEILRGARDCTQSDIISHLGVHCGRWSAVSWIVHALLAIWGRHYRSIKPSEQLPVESPLRQAPSLGDFCEDPTMFDCPPAFAVPLDKLDPWGECIDKDSDGISLAKQSLAQVWQALGSMILHAGDLSEDRVAHQSIMSQVLDILAQMHHVDALPSTIYNYVPAKDPSVIQRPPTIHLLSSRIMTLLSDVAWKRHWKSEMAKAQEYGYELPSPRVQPQLSQVESGVWLDLVLWACVESDLVLEAAWIVSQMQRRSQDWAKRWSVISWEEVCRTKAPKLAWTAILKLQLDKARLNQSTGIGIANGGVSSVTMGERTISREVIEAIIDGTVNSTCNTEASSSYPFNQAVRMTQVCKDLLEANDAGLDARACNALVLRVIESGSVKMRESALAIDDLLHLTSVVPSAEGPPDMSALSQGNDPEDHSASILGLLYSVLYTDSKTGESQRLMSTLDNITNLIDGNKRTYIREFASELRERLLRGPKRLSQSSQPLLYPETPDYIVAQLLDSTTANKSKSLGERLFDNNDIDGGFLRSHVYKSPNLQPALLRYATENADHTIVTRVLEQLQPPLSEDMLHSLLRSQVLMNEWNATQEILDHLKSSEGTSWNASDATSLAAAVLRLSGLKQRKVVEGSKAEEILSGIFAGRYDNASDPSRPRDFQRIQLANQIKRMLRTIPGNCFHCLNYNKDRETGRLSAKAEVSPQAFGILLEAVVERFGSAAGMTLWKQWCRVPSSRRYVHSGQYLVVSGVVKPELRLLRMIMRPIIQKLPLFMDSSDQKSGTDETQATNENSASATIVLTPIERSVVRWTVSVYQKFGLNAEDIGREFPRVSKPDLGLASIV